MTNRQETVLGMFLAAVLGMGGGAGFNIIFDPRPNPFTSQDARAMEKRIHEDFRDYVKSHYPYDEGEKSRMARLENKVDDIQTDAAVAKALLVHHLALSNGKEGMHKNSIGKLDFENYKEILDFNFDKD